MFRKLYYKDDKAYLIIRSMPIHNFERQGKINMDIVKECRDWLKCDHVLKTTSHFLFVETIKDAEIVENNVEISDEGGKDVVDNKKQVKNVKNKKQVKNVKNKKQVKNVKNKK